MSKEITQNDLKTKILAKVKEQQAAVNIRDVMKLEMATEVTPEKDIDQGNLTENSLDGYHTLTLLYLHKNFDKITPENRNKILDFCNALEKLKAERESLRLIEQKKLTIEDTQGVLVKSDFIKNRINELNTNKSIYCLSGVKGHHEIMKIEKRGEDIYVRIFNAGFESVSIGKGKVSIDTEYKLKDPNKLQDFLVCNYQKKTRSYKGEEYKKLKNQFDNFFGDKKVIKEGKPQGKGNCTTRSTRIMAAEFLGDDQGKSLHDFVKNNDQIIEAVMLLNNKPEKADIAADSLKTEFRSPEDNAHPYQEKLNNLDKLKKYLGEYVLNNKDKLGFIASAAQKYPLIDTKQDYDGYKNAILIYVAAKFNELGPQKVQMYLKYADTTRQGRNGTTKDKVTIHVSDFKKFITEELSELAKIEAIKSSLLNLPAPIAPSAPASPKADELPKQQPLQPIVDKKHEPLEKPSLPSPKQQDAKVAKKSYIEKVAKRYGKYALAFAIGAIVIALSLTITVLPFAAMVTGAVIGGLVCASATVFGTLKAKSRSNKKFKALDASSEKLKPQNSITQVKTPERSNRKSQDISPKDKPRGHSF